LVVADVIQDKVSRARAESDYGVVLSGEGSDVRCDEPATRLLRKRMRAQRGKPPFFDRGPGYRSLSGRERAEVDEP
jgi:N-methylhydantoinase B